MQAKAENKATILGSAIMLKQIEAEPILENCRALIDQIIDGLSVEKPFVLISGRASVVS
jgi:hypothetical protein